MITQYLDIGVGTQIGAHSDAVVVDTNLVWLVTSGTPGLSVTGALPSDFAGQAMLAWEHIIQMLEEADMTVADIVKVNQYLVRPEDVSAYVEVRGRYLCDLRPTSMLMVVSQLVHVELLVEVEVIAVKEQHA